MSPRTFARRFHDETGISPGRWLIQQRVAHARHLPAAGDLSVDQIAGRVGFATGASLRQHLHAAIGVSPRGVPQDVPDDAAPLNDPCRVPLTACRGSRLAARREAFGRACSAARVQCDQQLPHLVGDLGG